MLKKVFHGDLAQLSHISGIPAICKKFFCMKRKG